MGGFLDWLGSKADDTEGFLGNAWKDEVSQYAPAVDAIKSAADYGIEKSGQGLDFLTSMLGSTFDPTKPGMMDYTLDPLSRMRQDESGNVSVPTIGEQATEKIPNPFAKSLSQHAIDIARNPASALVTSPAAAIAMAPGMIEDTSKSLGTLWSQLGDQGKGLSDPDVQKELGNFIPSALMTGAGIHSGFHEVGPLSEAIPEVKFGDYSSRSPIEVKPTGWDERAKGSPSPVLGTAISEGGMKQIQPPDEAVTSVTDYKPVDERTNAVLKQEHLRDESSNLWEFAGNEIDPHEIQDPTIKAQVAKDNAAGKEYQARQTGKGATTYVNEDGLGIHIDENGNKTTVQNEPGKWADLVMNTVSEANKQGGAEATPKPIEIGDAIDSLARSLGYKDLPGTESRMVPPDSSINPRDVLEDIFTSQDPNWRNNPTEKQTALLNEAERGDPAGQVMAHLETLMRTQRSRTRVPKTYTPPVKSEVPTVTTKTDLNAKQQALFDEVKAQNPELDSTIQELQKQAISKPVSRSEESQPLEARPQEPEKPKLNPYQVFLDDGTRHTVRAENPEDAQAKAEEVLAISDKKVVDVKPKLSTLETAAEVPTAPRDVKALEKITKAQEAEDLQKARSEMKKETAGKSFKVTLDDDSVHYVRAKDVDSAEALVKPILERGEAGREIKSIEPRLSSLEQAAAGKIPRQLPQVNKPNPLVDKTAQVLDKISGGLKSSVMSTGIPGTGISPHGFSTLGRSFGTASYTTPMDNPVVASLKTMKYMALPSEAVKYMKANESYAKELEKRSPGFADPTEYKVPENILAKGHFKLFAEPLFQKIIPALKIEKAQTMEKFYTRKGMSPELARTKAIDDANVAFGGLKNWSQSRFNRIALFAPDWLETNARLATGTVKALANPNDPAGRMYRSYLANGLALYALKGAIQYGLTGTSPTSNTLGHKEDIKVGKEGIKDLFLRPEGTAYDSYRIPLEIAESIGKMYETGDSKYLGEIAGIGVNRLGPLKVAANILFNKNYKGSPLWGKDTYNRPIPLTEDTVTSTGRPFLSTKSRVTNELEGTLPQPITSGIKFMEGTAGPIEFMSKGLGLPLSATSYKIEEDMRGKGSLKKKSGYQSRYAF